VLGDMAREGELDEDAMDCGVIVGFLNLKKQFCFGDGLRELDNAAENIGLEKVSSSITFPRATGQHTSSAAFNFMRTYVPGKVLSVRYPR
jgi:hypothetical protein